MAIRFPNEIFGHGLDSFRIFRWKIIISVSKQYHVLFDDLFQTSYKVKDKEWDHPEISASFYKLFEDCTNLTGIRVKLISKLCFSPHLWIQYGLVQTSSVKGKYNCMNRGSYNWRKRRRMKKNIKTFKWFDWIEDDTNSASILDDDSCIASIGTLDHHPVEPPYTWPWSTSQWQLIRR